MVWNYPNPIYHEYEVKGTSRVSLTKSQPSIQHDLNHMPLGTDSSILDEGKLLVICWT